MIYVLLGALGSVVTGTLVDISGWGVAYGLSVGILLIGLLALLVAPSDNTYMEYSF